MEVRLSALSTVSIVVVVLAGSVAASSLRVCSFDTAVYLGDNVHLRCATEPGHMIRWFRGTDYSDVVYTGTKLNPKGLTDDRYEVRDDGNGSVDLFITAVKPTDAGVYMCYDLTTSIKAVANIVVVDPLTKSIKTVNQKRQSTVVDHTCSFTFHGQLELTVEWMDESGQVLSDVTSQTNVTDHVIESTTNDLRATGCRLTFELFSCGHHAGRIHFPTKQQPATSYFWMSSINNLFPYVWAIIATVVVLLLLGGICCKRFKIRKTNIQDKAKCRDVYAPLQYDNPVQNDYDPLNTAPPSGNTQQQSTQDPAGTYLDIIG